MANHNQNDPIPLPANALDGGRDWINTRGPIHLSDLKGKVVLLDFWTYCCINCHHILPELAKLEKKYPNQLVVIGVHSAKFDAEKLTENIRKKVSEYGIKHPVVNDGDMLIWNRLQVSSWPTLYLIDPLGRLVALNRGEIKFEDLDRAVGPLIERYRKLGQLNETPLSFEPEDEKPHESGLRYPGKITADGAGKRLFITDTGNSRIIITDLDGKHRETIGSGEPGLKDGYYADAQFNRPQGTCLVGETLYVADTESHAIRAIDLVSKTVTTVAGTGEQAPFRARGGPALKSPISSPWDIIPEPGNPRALLIAMAGPHQLWRLDLAAKTVAPWAGTGAEDIRDGSRAAACFAQPSGLATDGASLFVADSEGSCIRAVDLAAGRDHVGTIVGTHDLPSGASLFAFDDIDGPGPQARLQHCLGVTFHDGLLYIADTYNNKVKTYDPKTKQTRTLLGDRKGGSSDSPARFDEPGGLSVAGSTLYVMDTNNHAVRAVDLKANAVRTLDLTSVEPPRPPKRPPSFPNAQVVKLPAMKVKPGSAFTLDVALELPSGFKVNAETQMPYLIETPGKADVLDARKVSPLGALVEPPRAAFPVTVTLAKPAAQGDTLDLKLSIKSFLCEKTLCEIHSYVFNVPITFAADGAESVKLTNPSAKR